MAFQSGKLVSELVDHGMVVMMVSLTAAVYLRESEVRPTH